MIDRGEVLAQLETIETGLLSLIQQIRQVRTELAAAMQRNPQLECLLSAEEVAKLLGVETAYLYSLARTGKIPSFKLGKYRRFSPDHIKGWLTRKGRI
jgi:excisionase family DNA binding protein